MRHARTLGKCLPPAAALFALACALLAPVEAGRAARPRRRAPAPQEAQQAKREEPPADSTVRGRVVYDGSSRPVRRARVMLLSEDGARNEYAALTDGRGDFRIRGVRAGGYYAFVDAPGVLSPIGFISFGELRASGSAFPDLGEGRKFFDRVEVDGKQDVSVTVRARRGGAVAGRVTYADGDPAAGVTINLMRRGPDGRVTKYVTGMNVASIIGMRTDDRGRYRLAGLPPGEYLIGVTEAVEHGSEGNAERGEFGPFAGMVGQQLLMTFYPSATSVKEAAAVKVGAGDELNDVDVTIPERDLRAVSGVVRARRGGRGVAAARVTILRRDDPLDAGGALGVYVGSHEGTPNSTTTDEDGRWSFKDIPDGPYALHVRPPDAPDEESAAVTASNLNTSAAVAETNTNARPSRRPRRRRLYAPTKRDVEVSGGDVSEVVVEVGDGASVSGTLTVEGGEAPRYGQVVMVPATAGEAARRGDPEAQGGGVEGGQFTVEGLGPGKYFLQPNVGGTEGGPLYLKSITWDGKDLLRQPLELAEGAAVEGVQVVYARNPATLRVTLVGRGGKRPPSGTGVFLVPADLSAWAPQSRPLFCATDDDGACAIEAPPGDYRVVLLTAIRPLVPYEEEVRRRAPAATSVTLRHGEAKSVEIAAPDN